VSFAPIWVIFQNLVTYVYINYTVCIMIHGKLHFVGGSGVMGSGTIGNDPHFFIPLSNGDNLCYSVQGEPDFMFSLIKDKYLQLNAQFVLPAIDESDTIDGVSTFLGNLGILLRNPKNGKSMAIKVNAQDHSVKIGDETEIVVDVPVKVWISKDFNITASLFAEGKIMNKIYGARLQLNTAFGFGIRIRFYKKHLDMMITKSEGLTSEADGLMGKPLTYCRKKEVK